MLTPNRVKNGTTGACRITYIMVAGWLIFGWSHPAYSDEQPHLQLAPIKFKSTVDGNIGYTYMRSTYGPIKTTQQSLNLNVLYQARAQSYLWQPWLALVTGGFGIGVGANTTKADSGSANQSGNTVLSGDFILDVLAKSRYPFRAQAYRTNNQTSGALSDINSNMLNKGFSLLQKYRSRDAKLDSMASYNHNANGRTSVGTETLTDQVNFYLMMQPVVSQVIHVDGSLTRIEHPFTGDKSSSDTVVANHLYQPNTELSVGTFANLIKSSYLLTPLTISQQSAQNTFNSQQLYSFASWRPEESPLTVTGSARLLKSNSSVNGVPGTKFGDTNLNLGANYAWSPLLRMYGSVNVNDNSGIQTVSTNAAITAQKGFGNREATTLGPFRYTQFVGASLSNSTVATTNANQSTSSSTTQSLGLSLGHALDSNTELGSGRLITNLNQSLATVASSRGAPSTSLASGGSLAWSHTESDGTTMARLSANDSRSLSGTQYFFQLINLQASRDKKLARNQTMTGNLTIQASRSGDNNVTTPFTATPSADLSYHHLRLFSVKNLTFDSTLAIHGADFVLSKNDSSQNLPSQSSTSVSWDNNLNYFIGLLKMQLLVHFAEVDNVTQSSILFTMNRSF